MTDDFDVLDLDADRERRAAEREGKNKGLPLRMGGQVVATLPPELPLEVFEPLRHVDQDLALLLRQAMEMGRGGDALNATALVIDLLAANPNLPSTFLDVLNECGTRLLGEDGMAALKAYRPSAADIGALVKGVSRYYGLSLGESSTPSDSPENDGQIQSVTSNAGTESTPVASTGGRGKKAS